MKPITKPIKCLLCKKRDPKRNKPFCSHCYKHGDIFDKIKIWRENRLHTGYNFSQRSGNLNKKFYSKAMSKFNEEREPEEWR